MSAPRKQMAARKQMPPRCPIATIRKHIGSINKRKPEKKCRKLSSLEWSALWHLTAEEVRQYMLKMEDIVLEDYQRVYQHYRGLRKNETGVSSDDSNSDDSSDEEIIPTAAELKGKVKHPLELKPDVLGQTCQMQTRLMTRQMQSPKRASADATAHDEPDKSKEEGGFHGFEQKVKPTVGLKTKTEHGETQKFDMSEKVKPKEAERCRYCGGDHPYSRHYAPRMMLGQTTHDQSLLSELRSDPEPQVEQQGQSQFIAASVPADVSLGNQKNANSARRNDF